MKYLTRTLEAMSFILATAALVFLLALLAQPSEAGNCNNSHACTVNVPKPPVVLKNNCNHTSFCTINITGGGSSTDTTQITEDIADNSKEIGDLDTRLSMNTLKDNNRYSRVFDRVKENSSQIRSNALQIESLRKEMYKGLAGAMAASSLPHIDNGLAIGFSKYKGHTVGAGRLNFKSGATRFSLTFTTDKAMGFGIAREW